MPARCRLMLRPAVARRLHRNRLRLDACGRRRRVRGGGLAWLEWTARLRCRAEVRDVGFALLGHRGDLPGCCSAASRQMARKSRPCARSAVRIMLSDFGLIRRRRCDSLESLPRLILLTSSFACKAQVDRPPSICDPQGVGEQQGISGREARSVKPGRPRRRPRSNHPRHETESGRRPR